MGDYIEIGDINDGLRRVSTLHITRAQVGGSPDFPPGLWGYIDTAGKEIIKPQYIYATDFQNGTALVCKGKWELLPGKIKYNSQHPEEETARYGSKEELWGLLDKTGKEIIPCIYAELHTSADGKYVIAEREAGAKNSSLVMDIDGKVIFEPEGQTLLSYEQDGLVTVCRGEYPGEELIGLFDLKAGKWLFDCIYEDISVKENGEIELRIKNKGNGIVSTKIEKRPAR